VNNLGKTFKKIRKSKKLTQKAVCEGIIPLSTLSEFESGKGDIKLSKFYEIMSNINITFQEFDHLSKNYQLDGFPLMWQKAVDYSHKKNIASLKAIYKRSLNTEKKNIYEEINHLRIKNLLASHDKDYMLSQNERKLIFDYLSSISTWSSYELRIYTCLIGNFQPKTVEKLTEGLYHKTAIYKSVESVKLLMVQTLINSISVMLEANNISSALKFHGYVEHLMGEADLFERNVFLFATGAIQVFSDKVELGKNKMEKAIQIFDDLGSHNLAQIYKENYDTIIKIIGK